MDNTEHESVLIAIINNKKDFAIAKEQHWYRIPLKSAPKRVKTDYLAFYQTKVFGEEKWAVNYYAEVERYEVVKRYELLPEEKNHIRADEDYYKIEIGDLEKLPHPIISKKWRGITFIPTTWEKFIRAEEINDLFDESPLEDRLWSEFKRDKIEAERQYYVGGEERYYLDFALFCKDGSIDVECNGDMWHAQKEAIPKDNARNNYLTSKGWSVLRFSSKEINDNNILDCLKAIKRTVNKLGGIIVTEGVSRLYKVDQGDSPDQLELF